MCRVQGYDNTSGMNTKDKVMSAIPGKCSPYKEKIVKEPADHLLYSCSQAFARTLDIP